MLSIKNTFFFRLKLLVWVFVFPLIVKGQDLPKIIHPSPETSALFRFQDYPMDYSTGLPQISIPIYEVKSGSLTMPISISYHASGRRVYDQDGAIALGWSLNAGGMISRTVYGSVDFGTSNEPLYSFPSPFKLTADINGVNNLANLLYFQKIMHYGAFGNPSYLNADTKPWADAEYDVFSYSAPGISGKFIFKDSNGVKTPVLLPHKPYRVIPVYYSSSSRLARIDIIADNGFLYQFVEGETYNGSMDNATSGWVLSKMMSADRTDTITFSYTLFPEQRTTIDQKCILIDTWQMNFEGFPSLDYRTYPVTTNHEAYTASRLTQIEFNRGKVVFNLVNGGYKIQNIQIRNLNDQVLKTIEMNRSICYSQAELGLARYKLDALQFKDMTGSTVENYSFEYYPFVGSNAELNVRFQDWWGYYNNSGEYDMVPYYNDIEFIPPGGYDVIDIGQPTANRQPNLEAMKSGILKKIIYPTGGNTQFVYENNKCTFQGLPGFPIDGPGLRIAEINNADGSGTVSGKTYKYGANEVGYGSIELLPQMPYMVSENIYHYIGPQVWSTTGFDPERDGSYRERIFYSGFTPELSELAQRPVIYSEVTEYIGTKLTNVGKTVYQYNNGTRWGIAPMIYTGNNNLPKLHVYNQNFWDNPVLIQKADFKRTGTSSSASYQRSKETKYTYTPHTTENIKGLHVQRLLTFPQAGRELQTNYNAEQYAVHLRALQIYTYSDYQIPAGYQSLDDTKETIYNDDGSIISITTLNEYNSSQLIKKTIRTTSDGSSLINEIKYPFDYPTDPVLNQMVGLNMINIPVEQHEFKNTTPIKSIRTNFFNWSSGNPMFAPKTVEAKQGTAAYEPRIQYHSYDASGNVLSVSKEKDVRQSYLWGYNKTYPIAQVVNAEIKDVFHTSFEEGDGNSVLGDSRTGKRSKTDGFSTSLSGLSNGSYNLTYWVKSGSIWTFQKTQVTVSGSMYVINLNGQLDEIRFYPATADMITFTFEPLIGMLSQCDINNRISYYEYDAFGRLKLIRDMDNNILKTFKYKYQSTTP